MAEARSDLLNFIIDLDDDECPDVSLHVAAFQEKVKTLQIQLEAPRSKDMINSRVRPFLATPLRLAATGRDTTMFVFLEFKIIHGLFSSCFLTQMFSGFQS